MKRFLVFLVTFVVISLTAMAQQPPIIDRELFFGDPEIAGAQLSNDGKYISFLKPFNGVRNIWVKERSAPFESARPLTADTARPIGGYFWSRDSKYILYVQDKGGDENFHVYAVSPTATGDPVPASNDLTPLEKVRIQIYDVPKNTPNEIMVGINDRKPELHDVYRLNIVTGERKLIRQNEENVAGWVFDLDGSLRLGVRINSTGGTDVLRVDPDTLTVIYSVTNEESVNTVHFTPDGKKVYIITNKGGKLDKTQLELFDLATGKTELIDKDPENEVDLTNAIFSDVSNELLATFYLGDRVRVYPKQKKFGEDWERMKKALPDGEVSLTGTTADETVWMVQLSSDVDPGSRYIYDTKTGKAEFVYKARPELPTENLAPMKPVTYTARDGMKIHGYLTVPKGVAAKNLPTVMNIHGGPWARDTWGYDAEAQFLANRGYAVFQPNFRGSTGYGKKYLNAGNKQWGTGSMQHDISDAVKFLIKEGIADPKRVAIYGGSYGGYATLAGLAFTPDLYAAGISYVGPSNIITLLNSIPPYWAPIKKIFAVRVGDMDDAKDLKMLEAQSPLNSAKNIKAPLLVVQGANDPRVKKHESDQIVVAMRELGRQVEYLVAPDEGHGFAGRDNRMAHYTAMEKFFAKHLGGRYQESVTPEVQSKLTALTVDIKTVTLPEKPAMAESKSLMNAFKGSMLKPYTADYSMKLNMRGQEMTINRKRTISEATLSDRKIWRIVDAGSGPMGSATDTLDVDATTMLPIHRSGTQGMATMSMNFTSSAVEGKIVAGPQEMPIKAKTSGPVLTDGAGLEIPVSTLPLTEGYSGTIETFDMMSAAARKMSLKVSGSEKVTVAAGTFDTFKVELKSEEEGGGNTTLWISKDGRRTVKSEMQLPAAMGGGKAVTELVK
ncbi:MAG: prolyl oligopeptidase family serine peptidase [Ignavibacteriae bacterium]|nr:prolyl oligopeptidase family serine peptidase [Ignavibacteriota bacterium]